TDSLKSATRDKRRQGKAIQYQVRDDTNIKHIPLSRFLSHDQTKADLTDYLAAKILEYNRGSSKLIITSASGNTRSNKDLLFEENNHEEADTLLIHQAVLASHRNPADAQLMFFSPDTDILVLVTANYDLLLKNTSISMASGVVQIEPLWRALAYSPKGINIKTIPELRWHLFCKHRAEGDKLPPTLGVLKQHILRVHVQTRVWAQAAIALQDPQLDPLHNGYFRDSDGMKPTTTEVLPAPKAIIEMVQCRWATANHARDKIWHTDIEQAVIRCSRRQEQLQWPSADIPLESNRDNIGYWVCV
ncbi:hypothetical protein KUCAC02_013848, partial [Chaenocephalus aceratus]